MAAGSIGAVIAATALAAIVASPAQAATTTRPDVFLLATTSSGPAIQRVAPDGTVSVFAAGFTNPGDIAVDYSGRVYVADNLPNGQGTNYTVYNQNGSVSRSWHLLTPHINAIAVSPDNRLYAATAAGIYAVGTGTVDLVDSANAVDLAVSGSGRLYAATNTNTDSVVTVTPQGNRSTVDFGATSTISRLAYARAVATIPGSTDVWVSDANRMISPTAGRILRLNGDAMVSKTTTPTIIPAIGVDARGGVVQWNAGQLTDTSTDGSVTSLASIAAQPTAIAVAPQNLAAGAPVTALGSIEDSNWSVKNLTDGALTSRDGAKGYFSNVPGWTALPWATVDVGANTPLNSVVAWPRTATATENAGITGEGFPKEVAVDVSPDNATWTRAATFENLSADNGNPVTFGLPSGTTGRYVRLVSLRQAAHTASDNVDGQTRLTEIQVYGQASAEIAPTVATGSIGQIPVGVPVSVTYGTNGTLGASAGLLSGSLPPGLQLTLDGKLAGTPTTPGSYSFTLQVQSPAGTYTVPQVATVTSVPTLTGTPPNGAVGQAYNWTFGTSGFPAPTLSYTGTLPPGLSLNPQTGALTGTPTTQGRWAVDVQARNAGGTALSKLWVSVDPGTSGQAKFAAQPAASVETGAWENNTDLRMFQERSNQVLSSAVTVDGTTIPAGTKVNVYYVNADPVGNENVAHTFAGTFTFSSPVLGIAVLSADLQSTSPLLGASGTSYSTSPDQGAERWAGDTVTKAADGKSVSLSFKVYNGSDAVRIITLAP